MTSIQSIKTIKGVSTNANPLSSPEDLAIGDNCITSRSGLIGPRQGFDYYLGGTQGSNPASTPIQLLEFNGNRIWHNQANELWYSTAIATATKYTGSFSQFGTNKIRGKEIRGNYYFTSSTGVQKLTSISATPILAGTPAALDMVLTANGASGFQANNTQYAYRITWIRTDANNMVVEGAPSNKEVIVNTSGSSQNVQLVFTVPTTVITNDQYAIYRTVAGVGATTDPGDTMYLVYKGIWTSGTTVTYLDITTDALLSTTPLYTNANVAGIANSNYPPPLCADVELFRDFAFYANTKQLDTLYPFQLLGTGSLTNGVSTLTLSSVVGGLTETYTFNNAENIGTKTALLYTAGTASTNIMTTMKSLVRVINRGSSYWYAQYTSGTTDAAGIIKIWARTYSVGSWYMTCNSGATGGSFNPIIPTVGQTVISTSDTGQNRVYWSGFQTPECVALGNYQEFGSRNAPILRIVALTNSLMIMKTDGVYFMTGYAPPFSNNLLNQSCNCLAASTVARMNNKVFMLSNQGIVECSETGVNVVSYDIEPDIQNLIIQPNVNLAFGQGFEMERIYCLWFPQTSSSTLCEAAWCYNIINLGWTRWLKKAWCALVGTDNTMYLSSGQENALLKMRNTNTAMDQSDEEIGVTITAVADGGLTVTLTYAYSPVPFDLGFSLHQAAFIGKVYVVMPLGGNSFKCTLDKAQGFITGAATVRIPIYSHVMFNPNACGEAGVSKSFGDVIFMLLPTSNASVAQIEMINNETGGVASIAQTIASNLGWGNSGWGTVWGDLASYRNIPFRENCPIGMNVGETLTIGWKHSVSTEQWDVAYAAITYDTIGTITTAYAQSIVLK